MADSERAPECIECGCLYTDTHAEVERLDAAVQRLREQRDQQTQHLQAREAEVERLRAERLVLRTAVLRTLQWLTNPPPMDSKAEIVGALRAAADWNEGGDEMADSEHGDERKPIAPWQVRAADDLLDAVERMGRTCELELTWAGKRVVRAWRDRDGLHVEFPEGGVW